jgi:hypothetical protein
MLSENTVKESLGVTGAVKLRLMQKLKDEINSDYPCISRMEEIIEEIKLLEAERDAYRYILGNFGE